ncbi:hypothetical protein BRADI_3g45365v3 [Brachypodium distachyon]|uniref:BHLH domain-containing protein n=1 Tax=Brachypodium distachyon TaxID=15368 RepID=A0A0Q3FKM5_BRADI|nr:hypothetical protein BRADI_3g45365v3 [Brachypodium distachyon]
MSSGSNLIRAGAVNKGKGIVKEEEQAEEGTGGSKGDKLMSAAQAAAGRAGGSRRRGRRAKHITTERERRKRMSEMFSTLHGLLPSLPDKMDKSSIVMEAIHHIKTLEGTVKELEKRKQDLARGMPAGIGSSVSGISSSSPAVVLPVPAAVVVQPPAAGAGAGAVPPQLGLQTWSGQNVALSLSGDDAYINVCAPRYGPRMLKLVVSVLDKHGLEVITSGIASESSRVMFNFHTRVNAANSVFGDRLSSEDLCKLAVSEIMIWLSSAKYCLHGTSAP